MTQYINLQGGSNPYSTPPQTPSQNNQNSPTIFNYFQENSPVNERTIQLPFPLLEPSNSNSNTENLSSPLINRSLDFSYKANLLDVTCEQTYYGYIKQQIKKVIKLRTKIFSKIKPDKDNTKLIQQLDKIYYDSNVARPEDFLTGDFIVEIGSGLDYDGPYNEYLRLLSENVASIFISETNISTGYPILKLNPNLNLNNLALFISPFGTILNILKLLNRKNVNILSKLELGHIIKFFIIDQLKIKSSDNTINKINLDIIPKNFLDIIIGYVKYCSRQTTSSTELQNRLSDDEIKELLENEACFKGTVYCFVKFVHSKFNPGLKLDIDYIKCFSKEQNFSFILAEEIDWTEYSMDSQVERLISYVYNKTNQISLLKLYSMFYYNEIVNVDEFISSLDFIGLQTENGNEPFPQSLKNNLLAICLNYQACLNSENSETKNLIEKIGSHDEFIKLLLIYMSSLDVLVPKTRYTFYLTSGQQDILFAHTCFRKIDILDTTNNYNLHELTSAIISRIIVGTGFNRAG